MNAVSRCYIVVNPVGEPKSRQPQGDRVPVSCCTSMSRWADFGSIFAMVFTSFSDSVRSVQYRIRLPSVSLTSAPHPGGGYTGSHLSRQCAGSCHRPPMASRHIPLNPRFSDVPIHAVDAVGEDKFKFLPLKPSQPSEISLSRRPVQPEFDRPSLCSVQQNRFCQRSSSRRRPENPPVRKSSRYCSNCRPI